ncbi:hydrolase/acyltransferase [Paenibacillus swuensis]|uniref:Hydrolase/acyltransferase n=1 Tax=Paenibacillus swuensis TaxID=1178515 RepID=A0A172TJ84_9BACL|nr:hydrolase/acyltransferase [Paenibacillus swuensis]ANE47070.1 hydrolase/acyltransferase [Paenibacillus swuensis]
MSNMRYVIFRMQDQLHFVEMPADYAYQLSALNRRLHKELDKLTATNVPILPYAVAECDNLEFIDPQYSVISGMRYINELEQSFSSINERTYPLISLLTEIRALQAQLEQWYEEEELLH